VVSAEALYSDILRSPDRHWTRPNPTHTILPLTFPRPELHDDGAAAEGSSRQDVISATTELCRPFTAVISATTELCQHLSPVISATTELCQQIVISATTELCHQLFISATTELCQNPSISATTELCYTKLIISATTELC
jgi:hypothetical protein